MANISDDTLERLIDKIEHLTWVMERQSGRSAGDSKETYSSNRSNYDYYDYDEREEFEDLSGRQTTKVKKKKERKSKALQEEIDALEKNSEEIENENRPRIEELERLKASTSLLDEMTKYQEEINQLESEIAEVEKKRLDKIREKDELDNKSLKEYYDTVEKPRTGPKAGTKKAWEEMSGKEQEEYGGFDNYKQSVRDRRRQNYADKHGLNNTAYGRYSKRKKDLNERLNSYRSLGDDLSKNSKKYARLQFGNNKMGNFAAKGLDKFGKGLTKSSNVLGKFVKRFLWVIEALRAIGKVVGDIKKHDAELIKFQTRFENANYNREKQMSILATEERVVNIEFDKDILLKTLEVQGQNLIEATQVQNKQLLNTLQTGVATLNGKDATSAAYDAAMNMADYQADVLKQLAGKETREGKQKRYEDVRTTEYNKELKSVEAERNIADVKYQTDVAKILQDKEFYYKEKAANASEDLTNNVMTGNLIGLGQTIASNGYIAFNSDSEGTAQIGEGKNMTYGSGKNVNPMTGKEYERVGRQNDNGAGTFAGDMIKYGVLGKEYLEAEKSQAEAQYENAAARMTNAADAFKVSTENYFKEEMAIQKAKQETNDRVADLNLKNYEQWVDFRKDSWKVWLQVAQSIENVWKNSDKVTNVAGLNQGLLDKGQRVDFQKYLQGVANDIGSWYGKSAKEIAEMQTRYSESTGRNKTLGSGDYEKALYMGTRLGDENLVAEYGAGMEIFNHGVEDSVDLLDEALDNVNRVGLNGKKYAKDLVSNLKLAQKYNFKGGTKELMEMAKWAQQTRFNLGSLNSMIDKVQEGGIEGVITQSAGFQVLGGNAAINSDPLGMLYDAWADPQAYAKRMQDMTKGFGVFNSKTGETDFNINESMQIAQLAKLQGRSAEELRGEIMQRNKQNSVNQQLDEYAGFDDEQKAMISNKAEYKDGKWVVKMNDGEDKEVSTLSQTDLENLMPKTHEERIEALEKEGVGYLRDIAAWEDKLVGQTNRHQGKAVLETWDTAANQTEERMNQAEGNFYQNFDTNIAEITKGMITATRNYTDTLTEYSNRAKEMQQEQEKYENEIDKKIGTFSESLVTLTDIINTAKNNIANADLKEENKTNSQGPNAPKLENYKDNEKPNDFKKQVDWMGNVVKLGSYGALLGSFLPGVGTAAGAGIGAAGGAVLSTLQEFGVVDDGITSGNNKPMLVGAKEVTPVSDGEAKIAKTDPNDTALFAKTGGPFDKLFDGIFSKISDTYSFVTNMDETNSQISGLITNNSYDMKTGFESVIEQTNQNAKSIQFMTDTLFSGTLFDDSEIISVLSDIDTEVKKLDIDRRDIRSFSEKNTFEKISDAIFHPFNTFSSIISNNSSTSNKKYSVNNNNSEISNEFMPKFYKSASTSMYNNRYTYDTRNGVNVSNQSNKYTSRTYGGDSLSMAYDAWTDPQANVRRLNDIARGFGRVNPKTGERKFNINESMRIAQMAKLQGRSAEELRDEIIQRNKRGQIDNKDVRSASTNSVSNVYDGNSLVSNRFGGDTIASPTEVKLTINGKIELTGQNGQSIDIMDTLRNNPMFVRQITEMIVLQMNNNTHGGRNELFHNRFSG